ncbi:MAG: alpha/beta hydrolase [Bacteroidales bacterium]|nr:alpha/beta hydrolase [Bacteroidales bacterium]
MQYRIFLILILAFSVLVFQSCTDIMCILTGYSPREIRNSCDTPEPGTELSPRCNLILKHAEEYAANPDSVFDEKNSLLKLVKPGIKYTEDIYLRADTSEILMRLYCDVAEQKRDLLPVLIYYHGGGFIWGSVEIFDTYCRKLARETETVLVSVDYRLAPDYKYPTAVRDCYSALKWVQKNISHYGGNPANIIVMGESAGGNLAAVMPLVSRDSCGPQINAQIIVCGATTFEEILYPSRSHFMLEGSTYMISEDYLDRCKSAYLPESASVSHPYISPLNAEMDKEIPPAMVITAQVDPLRDEGKAYAMKMKDAGIDVIYREYEGVIHAFMNFYMFLSDARQAIKDVDEFIEGVSESTPPQQTGS